MKQRKNELGDKNIIGAKVTKIRKLNKMSQKELAINMQLRDCDINFSSLSKLEGQTRVATDREIKAIAETFNIKIDDLFNL